MARKFRKFRKKVRNSDTINLAPFVDILFVLLIVFMISTPIMLGGVRVELPEGEAEIIVVKQEPLIISIKRDGTIYIDKNPVKLRLLASSLKDLTGGNTEIKIYVKSDKNIIYDRVINIIGIIHSEGYKDVSLVTDASNI